MKLSNAPRAKRSARTFAYLAIAAIPFMLNACSSDSSATDAIGPDTTVATVGGAKVVATDAPSELAAVTPDSSVVPAAEPDTTVAATDSTTATKAVTATTITSTLKGSPAVTTPTAVRSNPDVDANAIPKLKNEVGALADVSVKSCAKVPSAAGDWKSAGTVANSTKRVATYVITTAFLDAKGTTVGLGFTKVERVNVGSSRDWAVTAPTTVSEGLQCIMRVTRGEG